MQCTDQKIINIAVKDGVNLFVTAEAYGDENQKQLGEVLSKIQEKTFIAPKVGINFLGKTHEDQFIQSREQIGESVKNALLYID